MKYFYKSFLILISVIFYFSQTITTANAACNWKSRSVNTSFWDSCNGKKYKYSVNAYIYFGSKSCYTYEWTVNGKSAGTNYIMNSFPITQNGTYSVCVKVSDTCNRCDTTYCSTRTITCVTTCNWKARNPYFSASDSCAGKGYNYSINGYIAFNFSGTSCLKYVWTINGTAVSTSRMLNHKITQNGTYVLCMKVTDTCNNCDTTFCSTRTITCIKSTCNWKSRSANYYFWDSCTSKKNKYSLNGYIAISSKSCYKYQWTVNSNNAGTGYVFNYPITANGTYSVCVKVTDTCNNCDTTYCTTRTITCVSGSTCNWKSRNPYFSAWDSCNGKRYKYSLNGYVGFNYSGNTCLKYVWTVNGNAVSTARMLHYPITQNGTYVLCLKATDTCNNCDTIMCSTRYITCVTGTCNWKARTPANGYWDSCTGKKNKYSLNAYVYFTNYVYKACLKYQWTVNGTNAGNTNTMSYPITANGTYSVCVKVSDTCLNCDTTYCTTRTITCVGAGTCNWKSRSPNYYYWDSCNSAKNRYSLNAYIAFGSKSCLKYQWTVNGTKAGTSHIMNYQITANGKYSVCVKVTDTCNNCDTTYCTYRTVTCLPGKCNWLSRGPYTSYWDSCTGKRNKYSLNAYISFTAGRSCKKYQWTVDGKSAGTGYIMNYPITASGTYAVCLKVTDTCNNCDTTFCTYRVFNCGSTKCNWKSKGAYFITKDTCITSLKNYSVNGIIYLPGSSSCYTYQWTVNSNSAGTNQYMNYSVTQNGTYAVCVKVKDTCNKCDTTYCSYVKVGCIPAGIRQISGNTVLKIYPNPTEGLVKLEWEEGTSIYIITNATGQMLQTGNLENGMNTLDLNKYSTGLYLIQVRTQNALLTGKISVQKR